MARGRGFLRFLKVTGSLNGLTRGPRRLRLAKGLIGSKERPPLLCRDQLISPAEDAAAEPAARPQSEAAGGTVLRPRLGGPPEPRIGRTIVPSRRRGTPAAPPAAAPQDDATLEAGEQGSGSQEG